MKLDILAIAAHPDDIELGCGGTLLAAVAQGKKVGILDLTRGELGTRGTPEIRWQESLEAAKILGVSIRENVGLPDGFFQNNPEHQLSLIPYIRKYQPTIVLANAPSDRHPDHGRASQLIEDACFLSGLHRIETFDTPKKTQVPWRPQYIYHFIQDRYLHPHFVVDITPYWEKKKEAIKAFRSQFYDPTSVEPTSYISTPEFLSFIEARAQEFGHAIGVKYGEGFLSHRMLGVECLTNLK
ncbi:MAG: bacillithiol biosynthesis deacetylase BshB1 [Runella sp.]